MSPSTTWARVTEGCIYVSEVKSLTAPNEERPLRLGLGQVLRYRHLLASSTRSSVRAVVAVGREPSDSGWLGLCMGLDVSLCWPPHFVGL